MKRYKLEERCTGDWTGWTYVRSNKRSTPIPIPQESSYGIMLEHGDQQHQVWGISRVPGALCRNIQIRGTNEATIWWCKIETFCREERTWTAIPPKDDESERKPIHERKSKTQSFLPPNSFWDRIWWVKMPLTPPPPECRLHTSERRLTIQYHWYLE